MIGRRTALSVGALAVGISAATLVGSCTCAATTRYQATPRWFLCAASPCRSIRKACTVAGRASGKRRYAPFMQVKMMAKSRGVFPDHAG